MNSTTLVTTTHRKSEGVSNGTGTQVGTQMINKCKTKMIPRELYNVGDPPIVGDRKNRDETLELSKLSLYPSVINL